MRHAQRARAVFSRIALACCTLFVAGESPVLAAEPGSKSRRSQAETKREPVVLKTQTGALHGTLDLPAGAGPHRIVLIISGSGPTDRDGNQPSLKNDCLRRLGASLAERGIAALRYDKRGVAESALAGLEENELRFDQLVIDAVGWIDMLQQDARFRGNLVLGHSEGALVAALAAQRARVGAIISLAGAGRPAPELLREQLARNLASAPALRAAADKIIESLAAGRCVPQVPEQLAPLFRASVQPYLISWFKHDPARVIADLKLPTLIIQGSADAQVSVDDARRLSAANKRARLSIIEGMNHVLKRTDPAADPLASYSNPALPIMGELVDIITAFIGDALGGRGRN